MTLKEARLIYTRLVKDGSQLSLEAAQALAWALDKKTKKAPQTAKAKAKSQSEVEEYCLSVNLSKADAEYLWMHWEENGWKNGSRAIKDWKLTIRKWISIGVLPKQGGMNQRNNSKKRTTKPGAHNDGF